MFALIGCRTAQMLCKLPTHAAFFFFFTLCFQSRPHAHPFSSIQHPVFRSVQLSGDHELRLNKLRKRCDTRGINALMKFHPVRAYALARDVWLMFILVGPTFGRRCLTYGGRAAKVIDSFFPDTVRQPKPTKVGACSGSRRDETRTSAETRCRKSADDFDEECFLFWRGACAGCCDVRVQTRPVTLFFPCH